MLSMVQLNSCVGLCSLEGEGGLSFLGCKCRPSDRTWDEPIAAACLQSAFESAPSVSGKRKKASSFRYPRTANHLRWWK